MSAQNFGEILGIMPIEVAKGLKEIFAERFQLVEEVRLRCGFPPTVLFSEGEYSVKCRDVSCEDLREVLERATGASVHTALEQAKNGYFALKGGHRIGLCGTVVRKDGVTVSLRCLSSISVRIAHTAVGQADEVVGRLFDREKFQNTLIIGSPGSGKTTLLRDVIRVLSDEYAHRVGVVDERGEIAAMWQGRPQFNVGRYTDILVGAPKAEGMMILLRGMNPQVLAVDEITHQNDVSSMIEAIGCGVSLLATAHGCTLSDLSRRPIYRTMLAERVFRRVVIVERRKGQRIYAVEVLN